MFELQREISTKFNTMNNDIKFRYNSPWKENSTTVYSTSYGAVFLCFWYKLFWAISCDWNQCDLIMKYRHPIRSGQVRRELWCGWWRKENTKMVHIEWMSKVSSFNHFQWKASTNTLLIFGGKCIPIILRSSYGSESKGNDGSLVYE